MPFEAGNQLSKKANHRQPKIWRDALLVSLKKANEEGVEAIQRLADKTVAEGLAGNMAAVKEIGERIDGKVPQAHIGGDEDDNPIRTLSEVRTTIVDPRHPDGTGLPALTPPLKI